jgi:hypothetical protein
MLLGILAHVLSDAHGTELRPAHGAEMCHFRTLSWKRLVVEGLRCHGIQRERKLIPPAELEPGLAERIVPTLKIKHKIA